MFRLAVCCTFQIKQKGDRNYLSKYVKYCTVAALAQGAGGQGWGHSKVCRQRIFTTFRILLNLLLIILITFITFKILLHLRILLVIISITFIIILLNLIIPTSTLSFIKNCAVALSLKWRFCSL